MKCFISNQYQDGTEKVTENMVPRLLPLKAFLQHKKSRQGDHLSTFSFKLVMEGLSRMLTKVELQDCIEGFNPNVRNLGISSYSYFSCRRLSNFI